MFTCKEFSISQEELDAIAEWDKTHQCRFRKPDGTRAISTIGGRLSIIFTPTAIGNVVEVECSCGQSYVVSLPN